MIELKMSLMFFLSIRIDQSFIYINNAEFVDGLEHPIYSPLEYLRGIFKPKGMTNAS